VLLEKHRDGPDLVRRFVEEAQIGGQLQHPGVVPVHELGQCADGRPFFSMKLVKGRTLAEELKDRADPHSDRSAHVATWLKVCQTMAYAHARGVIHRDLKPSNVMVGSFGEVQEMDWGLAKVLPRGGAVDDATAGTHDVGEGAIATNRSRGSDGDLSWAGSVIGTPAYIAPEQARGEVDRIDERCDVFALGSILCEILTGQPAFTGRTSAEVRLKTARGDLADATDRLDACRADPELVALARDCLAPEPENRPRTAQAVADRITSHLTGVQERLRAAEVARAAEAARAEEATHTAAEAEERARAERRARRFQVGLAASLLFLTTIGSLSFTYLLHQRQARTTLLAQVFAETTALRDKARREASDPRLWRDALAALRRVEGQGAGARFDALRAEIEAGLDEAERDARLRQVLVEVRANQQDVGAYGTDAAYTAAFRAARLDLDALAPAEFARRLRHRPAAVVIEVSAFLDDWSASRLAAKRSVAAWRKPIEAARLADPDPYRDRLRTILLAENRRPEVETLKALVDAPEAADLPAPTAVLLGRTLGALDETEAAVSLLRRAAGRNPDDVWINYQLAQTLNSLRPSSPEEAARYYTAARALRPETAHMLAHLLVGMGRDTEAEAAFRDLVNRRPDDARYLGCLGYHLKRTGRADAAAIADRATAAARAALRLKPDSAEAHHILGLARSAQGKHDEAVAELRAAIRLKPDWFMPHYNLGMVLFGHQYKNDEAATEYREALRLKPDWAEAHDQLGRVLSAQKKHDEAVAEFRETLRLEPDHVVAHCNLGLVLRSQGDYAGALAMLCPGVRTELQATRLAWPRGGVGCADHAAGGAGRTAPGRTQGGVSPPRPGRAPGLRGDLPRHESPRRRGPVLGRGAGVRPDARQRPPVRGQTSLQRRLCRGAGRRRPGQGRPAPGRRCQGEAPGPGPRLAQGRARFLGEK
jgi:serine/threonine-protein kinase